MKIYELHHLKEIVPFCQNESDIRKRPVLFLPVPLSEGLVVPTRMPEGHTSKDKEGRLRSIRLLGFSAAYPELLDAATLHALGMADPHTTVGTHLTEIPGGFAVDLMAPQPDAIAREGKFLIVDSLGWEPVPYDPTLTTGGMYNCVGSISVLGIGAVTWGDLSRAPRLESNPSMAHYQASQPAA